MPRYRHFLTVGKGERMPARIVGLACDSAGEPIPGDVPRVRECLTRWYACGWARLPKGEEAQWAKGGDSVASFWAHVDYAMKRGGLTWVVAWGATRCCGLLNLWEMLEDGQLQVAGGTAHPDGNGEGRSDSDCAGCGGSGEKGNGLPSGVRRSDGEGTVCLEDPPTVLRLRRPGLTGTLLVVDLENYGVECPNPDAPAERISRLALSTILHMVDTIKEEGWGSLRATCGAQAWSIWRHSYADQTVYVHTDPDALALEDRAYVGGRCECRFLGVYPGHVWHVDFRSLYGSITACDELPALLSKVEGLGAGHSWRGGTTGLCRVAEVRLRTPAPDYPYRPDSATYYPTGTFRTVLAEPELVDAEQHGRVLEYGRVAYYSTNHAARAYSLAIWKRLCKARDDEDALLAQWLKRLLVSLPGKFGARGYLWQPGKAGRCDPIWGQWWRDSPDGKGEHCRGIAGRTEVETRTTWAPEAVPAMAAYVTSKARMRLLGAIRQAGWDNVLYYDTDSLIVNETGWQYLIAASMVRHNTLGELRLIGRHERCEIVGIKHYILDGVRVCAGIPKRPIRPCSIPGYHWEWETPNDAIWQGHRPIVEAILRRYDRGEVYKYGEVGKDGWVRPLNVEDK